MDFLYLTMLGILSASFTSFFIAMESRAWKNINGRSTCSCGVNIPPLYLIPVLGSLLSNFTCNTCKTKFTKKMFFSEFMSILIFISFYLIKNETLELESLLDYSTILIIISASFYGVLIFEDLDNYMISDKYSLGAFFFLLSYFNENISTALIIIGLVYIFKMVADNYIAWKRNDPTLEAMGEGDILVFSIIGLLTTHVHTISNAFIIIPIIGLIFKFVFYKNSDHIPFVPAIIIGSIITVLSYKFLF